MYLTQALKRTVQIDSRGVATQCAGRERTWHECGERVAKLAGALRGLGVGDGERVAVLALNSDRYFEYFYAVPWAGGVFVPVNIRLAPPEVAFWLNDSGTEILFIDDNFLHMLEPLDGQLETVRDMVYMGDGPTPDGLHNYEEILGAADAVPDALRGGDDLAGLFYTGGTTGRSKGVMLSHTNLICNSYNVIGGMHFRPGIRWLHAAPMFHIADGLAVFGVTMVTGTHIFIPGFTPEDSLRAIEDHGVTNGLFVPTMMNALVNHPDIEDFDLSSLRAVTYGASPMPEAVIRRAMEVIPNCEFTHAYGQTECAPLSTHTGPEYHVFEGPNAGKYKSAGRAALGVEVQICDDDGNEVPRGDVGEVCVRGPNIMLGYWNRPDLTAEAIRDGWMRSGDGGYMDEDGFIYIVDRMKDMIISGGENIYSAEVEDVLHQIPEVVEAAVIGLPDEEWGERVHAIVRLREGDNLDAENIIAHCRDRIARFKCPKGVSFREEPMPLSGAGKILKTELRKPYWEGKEKQVN
ncbi:MAG: long-chain-fatty-acid--CoA ligase [Alphaproteobacteria bacterium]|nr:long-chain-fatty-acid--CoA ligase [Alphaproteobacteria bacterium]